MSQEKRKNLTTALQKDEFITKLFVEVAHQIEFGIPYKDHFTARFLKETVLLIMFCVKSSLGGSCTLRSFFIRPLSYI